MSPDNLEESLIRLADKHYVDVERDLQSVVNRSHQHRRWPLRVLIAGVLTASLLVSLVLVLRNNDNTQVTTAKPRTLPVETEATPATAAPAAAPSPSPDNTASMAVPTACRNSYEERCGPFSWDPQPSNEPIKIEVSFSPSAPRAGEEVIFSVLVTDPDAPIQTSSYAVGFGDPGVPSGHPQGASFACPKKAYGPWTPPKKVRGSANFSFTHVYQSPGTYTGKFFFRSHNEATCGHDAYGSLGEQAVSVQVSE